MSYSFQSVCYNCKKKEVCKDHEKIQDRINEIHMSNDGTHRGTGFITLTCSRLEPKS